MRCARPSSRQLPESPPLFTEGERTDRGLEFRIAETIREKLTLELNQEVPYGIAVEVEKAEEDDGQLDDRRRHLGGSRRAEADRHRPEGRAAEARRALGAPGAESRCSAGACT